jgi:septation ring formation regulator EzrA
LEKERRHVNQLENELKTLRTKYEDVCERVSAATHQLERVKVVLEETSRRCEQLEKEKV